MENLQCTWHGILLILKLVVTYAQSNFTEMQFKQTTIPRQFWRSRRGQRVTLIWLTISPAQAAPMWTAGKYAGSTCFENIFLMVSYVQKNTEATKRTRQWWYTIRDYGTTNKMVKLSVLLWFHYRSQVQLTRNGTKWHKHHAFSVRSVVF
jgi:hypothetical protein